MNQAEIWLRGFLVQCWGKRNRNTYQHRSWSQQWLGGKLLRPLPGAFNRINPSLATLLYRVIGQTGAE